VAPVALAALFKVPSLSTITQPAPLRTCERPAVETAFRHDLCRGQAGHIAGARIGSDLGARIDRGIVIVADGCAQACVFVFLPANPPTSDPRLRLPHLWNRIRRLSKTFHCCRQNRLPGNLRRRSRNLLRRSTKPRRCPNWRRAPPDIRRGAAQDGADCVGLRDRAAAVEPGETAGIDAADAVTVPRPRNSRSRRHCRRRDHLR